MITMAPQPEDLLRMSAKPIIPKVDPHATLTVPIGPPPPTPDLPISMSAGPAPDVSTGMAAPNVNSPASLPGIKARAEDRLMADYKKDADPYGSPDNHPGFFGKFLHGLNVSTGGVNRRQFEEQGLENRLTDLSKIESAEGLQGAQAENQTAQAKKAGEPENTLVPTSSGYQTFNPHEESPTLHPLATTNGQPAMPYVKPGPRQHVFLQGPNNTPIAATFDPQSGIYYDAHDQPIQNPQPYEKPSPEHPTSGTVNGKPAFGVFVQGKGWLDPNTQQPMPNFQPPPNFAETGYFEPITLYDSNTQSFVPGMFDKRSGHITPLTGGSSSLAPLAPSAQQPINQALDAAREADTRFRVMSDNAKNALKGDQQAMLSLLANHLGMTMGLQKGARMNQALIEEAERARPWLQGMKAKFDSNGYLTGVVLSPQQIKQMVALGQERRMRQWQQAEDTAKQYGVAIKVPSDLQNPSQTLREPGASSVAPPAGATQVGHDAKGNVAGWVVNGKWVSAGGQK